MKQKEEMNVMKELTNVMYLRATFLKKGGESTVEESKEEIAAKIKEHVGADDVVIKHYKTFLGQKNKKNTYIFDLTVTYITTVDPEVYGTENLEEMKSSIVKKFKEVIGADTISVIHHKVFEMEKKGRKKNG